MLRNSWVAEWLVASQEELSSMELVKLQYLFNVLGGAAVSTYACDTYYRRLRDLLHTTHVAAITGDSFNPEPKNRDSQTIRTCTSFSKHGDK
jgi:hypothetical protein